MHPQLSDYFTGAAGKRLSAVEADAEASHQHEINGVRALVGLLGEPDGKQVIPATFIQLGEDLSTSEVEGTVTWYDARERGRNSGGAQRSEYRLYYPDNRVMALRAEGDYLALARRPDSSLVLVLAGGESNVAAQLRSLFGLREQQEGLFEVNAAAGDSALTVTAITILEAIGVNIVWTDESRLEGLLTTFGGQFPTTAEFSEYARQQTTDVDPLGDPDSALLGWWNTEEVLFRTLERHLLTEALASVGGDVDAILSITQKVFQRRRARAGQALENHAEQLLTLHQVSHTRNAKTENGKRPDFVFPGIDAYLDPGWERDRLLVLGAKTTCKDRWRQVLTEADRVPHKHLLTLEAPVTHTQLTQMRAESLTLVIPEPLHSSFNGEDRKSILTVREWLDLARSVA